MPSLITHDFFGQDVYATQVELNGDSVDKRHAFLLGNQGPDPLFYSVGSPRLLKVSYLGSDMHKKNVDKLINAFKQSISLLDDDEKEIGMAYALGFVSHWALDSHAHPMIFAYEHAICNAGESDIAPSDHSEVHAVIETEIDEAMLYARTGKTVADIQRSTEILQASNQVLKVIDKMYSYVCMVVYMQQIPSNFFTQSTHLFRTFQGLIVSPRGIKRTVMSRIERMARPHSFVASMTHHPVRKADVPWQNSAKEPWEDPWTGTVRTESFYELYDAALQKAEAFMRAFVSDDFSYEKSLEVTQAINFEGRLVEA